MLESGIDVGTIRVMSEYGDWANGELIRCAGPVKDDDLDREMEVGPGTLRRTLRHILAGEDVWLSRWLGRIETGWPNERDGLGVAQIGERLSDVAARRREFLGGLTPERVRQVQRYRDSKGGLFQTTLGDMLLQGNIHSIHHRAQAVNLLRRLGAPWPELDYMMWTRRPA